VPAGVLLPVDEYKDPILAALAELGGAAPARTVIDAVGTRLGNRLTPMDLASLASGGLRWMNRVQFARLRLVEAGLVTKDSPKGTWELTDLGRARTSQIARTAS
jgi:hypothetical protein